MKKHRVPRGDLRKALNALVWCSGSADFNQGGKAKEGWDKLVRPLLRKYGLGR